MVTLLTRAQYDTIIQIVDATHRRLPADEQDRIARRPDELRDEELWERQFGASQDALSRLAAEARAERAAGRATELDPDKL
jgi:hypothetical protein